jgi:molecular chaperone GrpE
MYLIDRGMSNETENMKSDMPANDRERSDGASNVPRTPEEVMQAATAHIADLESELAEMKDRWMRSEAENANVRARAQREVNETRQYAVQKFAQDVVEAAENLHRGLESLPAPTDREPEIVARLREGLDGIERNFLAILERNGIRREDPTGAPFDPNMHQAMAEQESAAHTAGSVMHAWTPAWTLNGRLLRPAMVVVAKAPPTEIASASSGAAHGTSGAAKLNTTA